MRLLTEDLELATGAVEDAVRYVIGERLRLRRDARNISSDKGFKTSAPYRTPYAPSTGALRRTERQIFMTDETTENATSLDGVFELLSNHGYDITTESDSVLRVREIESGIVIRCVLEDNILFNSVTCMSVSADFLTPDVLRAMLASDNGISTSNFQLYERQDGKVALTLNNFCKLLAMGADDADDILSCLEFLEIDVLTAHNMIGKLG